MFFRQMNIVIKMHISFYENDNVLYIIMLIGLCCNTDRSIMLYTTIADATINMQKNYHNMKEFHTYKIQTYFKSKFTLLLEIPRVIKITSFQTYIYQRMMHKDNSKNNSLWLMHIFVKICHFFNLL